VEKSVQSKRLKKRKKCLETLSHRFVERKNFKDRHDEEIQKQKLDILNIEKEIKLKQFAILQPATTDGVRTKASTIKFKKSFRRDGT
jgi:hypothetical protein